MQLEQELDIALRATAQAAAVALHYQRRGFAVETKIDESPVTLADKQSEALIVRELLDSFPADGVLGEEGANRKSQNGRRWIIDPIDGTRDFVRGIPHWAIFVGLEIEGRVDLGVVRFPALGHVYYAVRGGGAFRDDVRIQVSRIESPAQAVLCLNGIDRFASLPYGGRVFEWSRQFWTIRSFGGALDSMLVASGGADAWVESDLKPWDLAAPSLIVEEAGGAFANFDGGADAHGGSCILCTQALMPGISAFFREVTGPNA